MYGETNSKSILEKQQMVLRITSAPSVVPRNKNVTIRTRHERKKTHENEVRPQRSGTSQTKSILSLVGHQRRRPSLRRRTATGGVRPMHLRVQPGEGRPGRRRRYKNRLSRPERSRLWYELLAEVERKGWYSRGLRTREKIPGVLVMRVIRSQDQSVKVPGLLD